MRSINGQVIKELREMRGWGQRELATKAGINQSVLSRLERNLQDDVMFSVVAALADALGTTIDALSPTPNSSEGIPIPELSVVLDLVVAQREEIQRQIAGVIRGYLSTMPPER